MSKKSFIDSVEVKSPCTEDWAQMQGNERVRFLLALFKVSQQSVRDDAQRSDPPRARV
jgi:hypothetical protein